MMKQNNTPSRPNVLRFVSPRVGLLVALLLVMSACLVTPPPNTRGWRCESESDCFNKMGCYEGFCRVGCLDDLDCSSELNETCSKDNFCLPPGPTCKVGDTRACYKGPAGTSGKGICKEGTETCTESNEWSECKNELTPKSEKDNPCNGKDDDCDGKVDNGNNCDCKPGITEACYGGVVGCTSQGGKIICKGICAGGSRTCGSDNKWGECKSWRGPDNDEKCNGKDDDCDGQVDDNVVDANKSCTIPNKQGPCAAGKSSCNLDAGKLECSNNYNPFEEDCNGKDDDCDGGIDNFKGSTTRIFKECVSSNSGCSPDGTGGYKCKGECKSGRLECLQPQNVWATTCIGERRPVTKEECNGKDEDCNGMIDDNTIEEGKSCDSGKSGVCKDGQQACKNGSVVCEPKTPPASKETCNGKDDDCNGQTDEAPNNCFGGKTCVNGNCQ